MARRCAASAPGARRALRRPRTPDEQLARNPEGFLARSVGIDPHHALHAPDLPKLIGRATRQALGVGERNESEQSLSRPPRCSDSRLAPRSRCRGAHRSGNVRPIGGPAAFAPPRATGCRSTARPTSGYVRTPPTRNYRAIPFPSGVPAHCHVELGYMRRQARRTLWLQGQGLPGRRRARARRFATVPEEGLRRRGRPSGRPLRRQAAATTSAARRAA